MRKTIDIMTARYPDIHVPEWQGRRLRGFFAAGQGEGSLLHNHGEGGRALYRYPLVQYKILGGTPVVLAAESGIEAVQPLAASCRELTLGDRRYPRGKLRLTLEEADIGDTEERLPYRFLTPWFGLNQDNHRRYEAAGPEERRTLLNRVLAGNLLSMAKGLGLTVEGRLEVDSRLVPQPVAFKGGTVLGFAGGFSVNYVIPELLGLGKSVSRGFGAVGRTGGGA